MKKKTVWKVYLAGECRSDHGDNWRSQLVGDSCFKLHDLLDNRWNAQPLIIPGVVPGGHDLCGAYIAYKGHQSTEFDPGELAFFHACHIEVADVVFAWMPNAGAGTYAELGFAHGLGKTVHLAYGKENDQEPELFTNEFCHNSGFPNARQYASVSAAWQYFVGRLSR